jgi:hypothetical protein
MKPKCAITDPFAVEPNRTRCQSCGMPGVPVRRCKRCGAYVCKDCHESAHKRKGYS